MSRRRNLPQRVNVEVGDLDANGFAMGVCDGREVLVKGALPGEKVEARVTGKRAGQLRAVAEAVNEPASERIDNGCVNAPRCGGCAFQHWSYDRQITFKSNLVANALQYAGVAAPELSQPRTTVRSHYRRKARLGVRYLSDKGRAFVGFRETFGSLVVDMDSCPALSPEFSELIGPLRVLVERLSVRRSVPQIELAAGDEEAAIVFRHLEPLADADLALLEEFSRHHRLWVFGQAGGADTVKRLFPQGGSELLSSDLLSYRLHEWDLRFFFGPTDFVQINAASNQLLAHDVIDALALNENDRLLDLFCGLGNFTLPAAQTCAHVVGIEASERAVALAKLNAEKNGLLSRTDFCVHDLYSDEPDVSERFDKLLLDPPRSGAGPFLEQYAKDVQRVVYVSCNPTTFATDARRLERVGFQLMQVCAYDMFPQTAHVETLGTFVRQ